MTDGTSSPLKEVRKGGKLLRTLKVLAVLLFLAGGFLGGLAVGGGLYVLAGNLAPRIAGIPFVGENAGNFLRGLKPPMNRFERREFELRQTEERLLSLQGELEAERARLEEEKRQLAGQKEQIARRQEALAESEAQMAAAPGRSNLYEEMAESFKDMPPAGAAKIIVRLPAAEAADILARLGSRERGDILSRMPVEAAAKLMGYLRRQWAE